jgi:hypothetical protein
MPQDKPIVRFRQYLQEWEDRGWRIDRQRLHEQQGDVGMAIPSPARRESKNWILDPVPLMPAADRRRAAAAS